MEEYRVPKLIGNKAPLNCLVLPDQHYRAWPATQRYNMSFGEYVGALIDRAEGRPTSLMGCNRGYCLSKRLGTPKAKELTVSMCPAVSLWTRWATAVMFSSRKAGEAFSSAVTWGISSADTWPAKPNSPRRWATKLVFVVGAPLSTRCRVDVFTPVCMRRSSNVVGPTLDSIVSEKRDTRPFSENKYPNL